MLKLYYYRGAKPNFGDELNTWLWPQIFPGLLGNNASDLFLGIGTILNEGVPDAYGKVVFGSGYGYGIPPLIDERWKFYCVRGPITAQALGLEPSLAVCDPAILVNTLLKPARSRDMGVAFMPHFTSAAIGHWQEVCDAAGVRYLDPCADVEETLDTIRRSTLVISEAMHGVIVADALRTPWIAVEPLLAMHRPKWQDWCLSLDMEYRPSALVSSSLREHVQARYRHFRANVWHAVTKRKPVQALASSKPSALAVRGDVRSLASFRSKLVRTVENCIEGPLASAGMFVLRPEIERRLDRWLIREAAAHLSALVHAPSSLSGDAAMARATERLLDRAEMLRRDRHIMLVEA